VQTKLLVPSVQHAEKTNFCAKVSRITSDLKKCFGAGPEQQVSENTTSIIVSNSIAWPLSCQARIAIAERPR
jgi:hypothetical protein